mgnify:CR=1 FL=1
MTPGVNTIAALADFLQISTAATAKAIFLVAQIAENVGRAYGQELAAEIGEPEQPGYDGAIQAVASAMTGLGFSIETTREARLPASSEPTRLRYAEPIRERLRAVRERTVSAETPSATAASSHSGRRSAHRS